MTLCECMDEEIGSQVKSKKLVGVFPELLILSSFTIA